MKAYGQIGRTYQSYRIILDQDSLGHKLPSDGDQL
jgi:hypothetical protein